MTEDEAREQAFDLMANILNLDEFQRIAVHDLILDVGAEIPKPGSIEERKMIELGAIVSENIGSW